MLLAQRQSDGQPVIAYFESKRNAPFLCLECNAEGHLRTGKVRINHFSHKTSDDCEYGTGETEAHRRSKMEIYESLLREPGVANVALERSLGAVRPDISADIRGVPVAIEVQISNLSQETIIHRTQEYERKGIYVLWLPQWSPYLDGTRYSPRLWEKWVHAAYFGRVYYWIKGLTVASYEFEPQFMRIPESTWFSKDGKKMTADGYIRKSKRWRTPFRHETLNIARDFVPRNRDWWKGGDLTIPFSKLFMAK